MLTACTVVNPASSSQPPLRCKLGSSRGGSLGVGFTAGPGGTGINLSASVNHGKGRESGNGVSHNETTLDARQTVTLNAGRMPRSKGAQVSGEQITADVKRNLTLISEQDKADARAKLAKTSTLPPTEDDIKNQIYNTAYNQALNDSGFGTGGKYQTALQAATAAIQGLAGGNIGQALAGGASPYLAGVIKGMTTDPQTGKVDITTNTLAHAILGAAVAEASGNSALAGAAGAASGELAAQALIKHFHGENVKVSDLSEEEKQTISTLSTLAAGLAGGIAGDSTGSAVTGAQAGKNAVENNFLSFDEARAFDKEITACKAAGKDCQPIIDKYAAIHKENSERYQKACQENSLVCAAGEDKLKIDGGISAASRPKWLYGSLDNEEVKNAVLYVNSQDAEYGNKHTDNWDRAGAFIAEPENVIGLVAGGHSLFNSNASAGAKVIGTGLSMGANAGVQVYNGNTGDKFDYTSLFLAGFTGWTGTGRSLHSNVQLNAGSAYFGSQVTGQNSEAAVVGATFGTTLGYGFGSAITSKLEANAIKNYFGMPASRDAFKYAEKPVYSNFISGEAN